MAFRTENNKLKFYFDAIDKMLLCVVALGFVILSSGLFMLWG